MRQSDNPEARASSLILDCVWQMLNHTNCVFVRYTRDWYFDMHACTSEIIVRLFDIYRPMHKIDDKLHKAEHHHHIDDTSLQEQWWSRSHTVYVKKGPQGPSPRWRQMKLTPKLSGQIPLPVCHYHSPPFQKHRIAESVGAAEIKEFSCWTLRLQQINPAASPLIR